jgi:malate:Na+ symporter
VTPNVAVVRRPPENDTTVMPPEPEPNRTANGELADMLQLSDLPWWFVAVFAATIAALVATGSLPNDLMGGFGLLFLLGLALGEVGERLPYVNTLLGGGPVICIFGAAMLVYWSVLPPATVTLSTQFLTGSNFLNFYIASVITGAMLRMNRAVFLGAALPFVPVLACGIVVPVLLAIPVAMVTQHGWSDAMLYVIWPVLGGGVGAGAVPLAQIYSSVGNMTVTDAMSRMMPAVVLGNLLSILVAAQLNLLGRIWPATTGNGRLIRRGNQELLKRIEAETTSARRPPLAFDLLGAGFALTIGLYLVAVAIEKLFFPSIHAFVWMIAILTIAKMVGLLPPRLEAGGIQWYELWSRNFLYTILAGIGIAYTDMSLVFGLLRDPVYLTLVVLAVLGATVGSGIAGHLTGLYFVESAIAGGLGMAAMGQTGDIASLSAARRMELLPFTTLSTRIGGAVVLLLAGLQLSIMGR